MTYLGRWLLTVGLLLALGACGDEPPPGGAPAPAPGTRPVETFAAPRFFVQLGPRGHVSASFGTRETEGAFVAAGELGQDEGARTVALGALRRGLFDVLGQEGVTSPGLLLRAGSDVPWRHVAAVLAIALDPEIDLTSLDLRLPWDEQPRPADFAVLDPGTPGLAIEVGAGSSAGRTRVQVGKSGDFQLVSGSEEADRVAHSAAISGLRSALQGFAGTWKEPERRAEIRVAAPGDVPYIHVLAVIRICREKGFETITLGAAQ